MATNNAWNSQDPVQVGKGGTGKNSLTLNGVVYGNGTAAAGVTAQGAANTVLLGNGGVPSFGQVPNGALVNSSVTINGGNNVTVTGGNPLALGGVASINVTGTVDHAVLVGNATGSLTSLTPATSGQVIVGNTGANPSFITPTAGNGLAITSNATTLEYALSAPVSVPNGGTGQTSLLDHGLLVGSGTAAVDSVAVGTTNTVLLGNTGADPSFGQVPNAALANSSVTINNGNNITFTGANPLALGGTASANLTGTTDHAVQLGNATGSLTSMAVGTNGQIMLGATGADPSWVSPTAGTGLSITSNSTTLQYALSTPVSVANGGTGNSTFTAYSVICAGTTATGAFQNVSGLGSAGQVLTSNGAAALPSWQSQSAVLSRVDVGSSPYVVAATDAYLSVDTSGAARTIQLPNSTTDGRWIVIKDAAGNAATNNITVTTVGAAIDIDGATSYTINVNYGSINVIYNNTASIYEIW